MPFSKEQARKTANAIFDKAVKEMASIRDDRNESIGSFVDFFLEANVLYDVIKEHITPGTEVLWGILCLKFLRLAKSDMDLDHSVDLGNYAIFLTSMARSGCFIKEEPVDE